MRYILTIIAVLLFAVPSFAEVWGGDFGMVISDGTHPALGYAITKQFSIEPLGGQIFKTMSVSAVYSDFDVQPTEEVYAARTFAGRQFVYKHAYIGLGVGGWAFVNSDGGDFAATAAQATLGFRFGALDLHFGGDVVSRDGNDIFYPFGGLIIGL